jgi:thioredoxin reductase (NADPH)
VILASGLTPGTVRAANEATFEGSGLSHCAACDGPLYKDLPVVVIGHSRWAVQEATELATVCSQVTLVTERADVAAPASVAIMRGKVTGLDGQDFLESVTVRGADGSKVVPARGIFIQDGRTASVPFARQLERDDSGFVGTTETGATNLPMVFAAGSLRTGLDSTIPQVVADGVRAAQAAIEAIRAF